MVMSDDGDATDADQTQAVSETEVGSRRHAGGNPDHIRSDSAPCESADWLVDVVHSGTTA